MIENFEQVFDQSGAVFGKRVAMNFPSSVYDIVEAGNCLLLHRSTACVMHLMRALETPLTELAKEISIPIRRENWNDILNDIQKKIRSIDGETRSKDLQEFWNTRGDLDFYTDAIARFFVFKNAWRNYAMHAKDKYTEEEAEEIFNAVKSFMRHLSSHLSEK